MQKEYSENDLEYMQEFILEYISEQECEDVMGDNLDCIYCDFIEDCFRVAGNKCNTEWAKSIDYGGCDSEEQFWELLLS